MSVIERIKQRVHDICLPICSDECGVKQQIYRILDEEAAKEDVPKIKAGNWIPCRKELPESSGIYTVTVRIPESFYYEAKSIVCTDEYDAVNEVWEYEEHRRSGCKVLAWMSLPEPWKEQVSE